VYKKIPCCADLLYTIICRILKENIVPPSYGWANITLIPKDLSILSNPGLFRPIACANVEGKILWAILSISLTDFLIRNQYIKDNIQKGFLPNVAGCIEHTAVLVEALRDARSHKRNIVVNWIDLANAFGSVRHNLILFALDWYHVPKWCCHLIYLYYSSLFAKVSTSKWTTSFFPFEIGVFQGCTISPILFDLVYQLCIDYVNHFGTDPYVFSQAFDLNSKFGLIELFQLVYADDHTIINRSLSGAQSTLDLVQKWLTWTDCMKAKPSKCRCLALINHSTSTSHSYGPIKAGLKIGSHLIIDISDFKFLGRYISKDLSDKSQQASLFKNFEDYMKIADEEFLKGSAKAWMYKHFIMSFIIWPLTIYDFAPYIVDNLTAIANRYLKSWLKVLRPVSPEVFYLPEVGLNLPHPGTTLKCLQISKQHLLSTSRDPRVRYIYESKLHKAIKSRGKRWSPETTLLELKETLKFESKFLPESAISVSTHMASNFNNAPTKTKRKLLTMKLKKLEADKMRIRLLDLCKNGNFTTWDNIMSSDITWKDMIYDLSENVVSFRINAISNCLPSPSNLHRWGIKSEGSCSLCNKRRATAAHILSHCYVALKQDRYTWRHDNVLAVIHKDLVGIVNKANSTNKRINIKGPTLVFVKEGNKSTKVPKRSHSILTKYGALDWRINFDFRNNATIPSESKVDTLQRPDIVIYSISKKIIIWFEETIPLERNIVDAALRKEARYASLKTNLKLNGWSVHDFTFEIGALGFIAKSFNRMLITLGLPPNQRKFVRKRASKMALRSSFYIWSNRFNSAFISPKLVTIPLQCSFPTSSPSNILTSSSCNISPIPKTTPPPTTYLAVFKTPARSSTTQKTPLSTLSKFRQELNAMTPIDEAKWSNFDAWSAEDKKWFREHIPRYELDCMMDVSPLKNSIRDYCRDQRLPLRVFHPPRD